MFRKMWEAQDLIIQIPPEGSRRRDKLFIIDYEYCEVYLDTVVEEFAYVMNDQNLWNPRNWQDNDSLSRCFVGNINRMFATGADYVVIPYNADVIGDLGRLAEDLRQYHIAWYFTAFFHNDQETLALFRQPEKRAGALERKAAWLKAFSQFPFIKQVEAPRAAALEYRYLDGLFGIKRE